MKYLLRSLLSLMLFSAALVSAKETAVTRIIFVVGDGMGMEYLAAYRHFQDDPATPEVEATLFDDWLTGTAATHPVDVHEVTDSAASATALSAGIKTYNGAIGMDRHRQPVETLLERAKKSGFTTAMVVTSQINHATPASFAAHVKLRKQYNDIADQYLDNRYQGKPWVDVLIGGGVKYFVREDRNLVASFKALDYQYTDNLATLDQITRAPALALVADDGLAHAIDSDPADRLALMTDKALSLMPETTPFFMLVEASQIDWCGHANDIACAMREMHDAEVTLKVIKAYADSHPGTLVVVTADHSTGGLSLGVEGEYQWAPDVVRAIKASASTLVDKLVAAGTDWPEIWQALTSIALTETEQKTLQQGLDQIAAAEVSKARNIARDNLRQTLLAAINRASYTGWTTSGHTGGDVAVMAYGAGHEAFGGHMDNTEIAKKLFSRVAPAR